MSHQSKVQTATYRHPCSNSHRRSLLEVHQGLFLFVSEHPYNSEVSKNRLSEHEVSFLVKHDSEMCNLSKYFRNSVKLPDVDLDLGLLHLLLKKVVEIHVWGRFPYGTQRWVTTAVLLARFHPSCVGRHIHCLLCDSPPLFDLNRFTLMSDGGIVFGSSASAIHSSPVQLPPRSRRTR